MNYIISGLTNAQAQVVAELFPSQLTSKAIGFDSVEQMQETIATLRVERERSASHRKRSTGSLIAKINKCAASPMSFRAGVSAQHPPKKEAEADEMVISCTKAQVSLLRDVAPLQSVRWASISASRTECFIHRTNKHDVAQQLRGMYRLERERNVKRVISTFLTKLGAELEAIEKVVARRSDAARDLMTYLCEKEGIALDTSEKDLVAMLDPADAPLLIAEAQRLAKWVKSSARVCEQLIAVLSEIKIDVADVPTPAPLPTSQLSLFVEPTAEDLAAIEAEEEAEEEEDYQLDDLVALTPWAQLSKKAMQTAVVPDYSEVDDAEPEDNSWVDNVRDGDGWQEQERDWESLDDLDEDGDDDDWEDDYTGWLVISNMAACLDHFGYSALKALGAAEWDGDMVVFKDPEERDCFCNDLDLELDELEDNAEMVMELNRLARAQNLNAV